MASTFLFSATVLLLGVCGSVMGGPFEPVAAYSNSNAYPQREHRPEPAPVLDYLDENDGQYREELYSNANSIPGVPGVDYPTLANIPPTGFSCTDKLPGFYADEEAACQVWHYCKTDGLLESFLCPNGTVYNQANRVCEWWFNVQCEQTEAAYRVNEDLYIIPSSTPEPAEYPINEQFQGGRRAQQEYQARQDYQQEGDDAFYYSE